MRDILVKILFPLPLFIIAVFLIALSSSNLFFEVQDIINFGAKYESVYKHAFDLGLYIILLVSSLLALLKNNLAIKVLFFIACFLILNHFLGIFMGTFGSDQTIAILLLSVIAFYLHNYSKEKK